MATVSGALLYDSARTGAASPSMPGIANVPIVLQNMGTNALLGVNTDANGRYRFINVPPGDYRIIEAYGATAGASPGDFSQAVPGNPATAALPPISFVQNPPQGALSLEAVTPSTLNVAVGAADLAEQNFLNAPSTRAAQAADVSVSIEPDLDMATGGEELTYAITLRNDGPGTARGVTLRDQVPPEFQNPEYSIDSGDTWLPWTGSYTRDTMDSGSSLFMLLRGTVSPTASGFITNTATVESGTPDPNTANNTATDRTPLTAMADIEIQKSADKNTAQPGEQLTYTLSVKNIGPNDARNVQVTDRISLLLSNPEFSQDGGTWEPWPTEYLIGGMTAGTTVTLKIRATVSQTAQGRIFNTASVNSTTPDPVSGNNSATVQIPVGNAQPNTADVAITKQADKNMVNPGDLLTYTIRAENLGPGSAGGVTIRDEIPPLLSGAEYSLDGSAFSPWTGSRVLGELPNGASRTILLRGQVSPTAAGSIQNTATVESTTQDPDSGNNSAMVNTPVGAPEEQPADLSVTKQADRSSVQVGQALTYTLQFRNNGPGTADNVVLTDSVSSALDQAEYSPDGGTSWFPWPGSYERGDMASGSSSRVLLRGRVKQSASGSISNTASVNSATPDPNTSNNTATVKTTVEVPVPTADLTVTKQASTASAQTGQLITYTVTITNNGPDYALDVTLNDTIPSTLAGAEYSADNGTTWQSWPGSQSLGTIARGTSVTRLIRGRVTASSGVIENMATVRSTTTDPNVSNNSAAARTTITPLTPPPPPPPPPPTSPSAELAILMRSDLASVHVGDTLTYTITARNIGPGEARGVVLTSAVSPPLVNTRYSSDNGSSWQAWPGTISLGNMENGAARTVLLRGQVSPGTGSISNTAMVSSTTPSPSTGQPSSAVTSSAVPIISGPTGAPPPQPTGPTSPTQPTGPTSSQPTGPIPPPTGPTQPQPTGPVAPPTGLPQLPLQPPGVPQLTMSKTAYPCPVYPCQCVTFTLRITNTGTKGAGDVFLTDLPCNGLCWARYSLNGGMSVQPFIGVLPLGYIPAGTTMTVLLQGIVSHNAVCPIFSVSRVTYTTTGKRTAVVSAGCTVPIAQIRPQ